MKNYEIKQAFKNLPNAGVPDNEQVACREYEQCDYGRYFIQSSDRYEYDDELGEYYDYERFGKDRIAREHGVFDEAGYIAYNGTLGFDEIMEQKCFRFAWRDRPG